MRERASNNVGEAGDEEVSRLAIAQHIVVTISADTPIYVVLEQTPKPNQRSLQPSARSVPTFNSANVEQLRQLLQLQQELNRLRLPRRAPRNVAHESTVTRPQAAAGDDVISNFPEADF
jgi:hypothetical protein